MIKVSILHEYAHPPSFDYDSFFSLTPTIHFLAPSSLDIAPQEIVYCNFNVFLEGSFPPTDKKFLYMASEHEWLKQRGGVF